MQKPLRLGYAHRAMSDLPILYRDDRLVVIAKPAGLLTHPGTEAADADSCLSILRRQVGRWLYPFQRLDRATSGVLAFALTPDTAREMADALAARRLRRTYLAVTRGFWAESTTVLNRPLTRARDGVVQEASTTFHRLGHLEQPWPTRPFSSTRWSLVEAIPATGRTHQIRRHAAGSSHPILGDTSHGDGAHNQTLRTRLGMERLMLHAFSLELPGIGLVTAPLDDDWRRLLDLFGLAADWVPPPAMATTPAQLC